MTDEKSWGVRTREELLEARSTLVEALNNLPLASAQYCRLEGMIGTLTWILGEDNKGFPAVITSLGRQLVRQEIGAKLKARRQKG